MLVAFFLSLVMTAAFIHLLRRTRIGKVFLDYPKARGLHAIPVPRIGGLAMFASVWLLAGYWLQRDLLACIGVLSLVLLAISLLDDLHPISALMRLLVHASAAILSVLLWVQAFGMMPEQAGIPLQSLMSSAGAMVIVFCVVWMTNLYNFMDGADGLAGGMAFIGFGTFAIAASLAPDSTGSLVALTTIISGAACGFLLLNFPPAKIFMGDAGAIPLGFLAATLGIHGSVLGIWEWWFALLVFSPFIVDATVTLLRRTTQGYRPWIAHRDNYYQRLILSGWSQRKTALAYYGFMLAAAGSALGVTQTRAASATLLAWVIIYVLLLLLLERRLHEKKNNKSKNNDRETT